MPKPSLSDSKARSSHTARPFLSLLELLGRRWALRVLWELRDDRLLSFRQLRDACDGVSPTVLNERLKELRDARLVEDAENEGYGLTSFGRELVETRIAPLAPWSERWARAKPRGRPA